MWYKHRLGLFQFIKWTLFRQAEVFSSHHTLLRLDKAVDTGSNHRGESGGGGGVGRNRWLWRCKIGKSMLTSFFCLFYVSKLWILDLTIEGKVCGGRGGGGGGRNRWLWRCKIGKSMLTSFFGLFYVSN